MIKLYGYRNEEDTIGTVSFHKEKAVNYHKIDLSTYPKLISKPSLFPYRAKTSWI